MAVDPTVGEPGLYGSILGYIERLERDQHVMDRWSDDARPIAMIQRVRDDLLDILRSFPIMSEPKKEQ